MIWKDTIPSNKLERAQVYGTGSPRPLSKSTHTLASQRTLATAPRPRRVAQLRLLQVRDLLLVLRERLPRVAQTCHTVSKSAFISLFLTKSNSWCETFLKRLERKDCALRCSALRAQVDRTVLSRTLSIVHTREPRRPPVSTTHSQNTSRPNFKDRYSGWDPGFNPTWPPTFWPRAVACQSRAFLSLSLSLSLSLTRESARLFVAVLAAPHLELDDLAADGASAVLRENRVHLHEVGEGEEDAHDVVRQIRRLAKVLHKFEKRRKKEKIMLVKSLPAFSSLR